MTDMVRWMVHGYRWCPHYKNIYEWDESQVHGCLWCSEWGADDDHPRLGVLAAAGSATPIGDDQPYITSFSGARTPDADVHYDACHSTKCPCFLAGVAGSATPTEEENDG